MKWAQTGGGAGRPELLEVIRQRIEVRGPIAFADFMELALYHPEHGYYARGPGARDYATSPAVSPGFGELLARQVAAWWRELGAPRRFHVVEAGGGGGWLAADLLRAARADPELAGALEYHLVERRPPVPLPEGVSAHGSLSEIGTGLVGCVLSNELLDALPVHIVTIDRGRLREILVDWLEGRLVEVSGEPSTPRLASALASVGATLTEGARAEVCLAAHDWLRGAAALLARGYVLTIDYGYEAVEYYSPERRRGTLLCYHRHTVNDEPLLRVGEQDITAHAEFSSLMRLGDQLGLEVVEFTSQRKLLHRLGLRSLAESFGSPRLSPAARYAASLGVLELARRGGLGDHRVLIQRKRE